MLSYDIVLVPAGQAPPAPGSWAGWAGSLGPALGPAWPRGPLTGLPMLHVLTLLLSPEYRRRGTGLVAASFFQGEGQDAEPVEPAASILRGDGAGWPADPLTTQLRAYAAYRHPQETILTDAISGRFARVFLTQAEYDAGPRPAPPDVRPAGYPEADDEGPNTWDYHEDLRAVWLVPRQGDPNAGLEPSEDGPYDRDLRSHERGWRGTHLGGTSEFIQAVPEGLTPFFLGIDEADFAHVSFGTGTGQLSLESDVFDWACD